MCCVALVTAGKKHKKGGKGRKGSKGHSKGRKRSKRSKKKKGSRVDVHVIQRPIYRPPPSFPEPEPVAVTGVRDIQGTYKPMDRTRTETTISTPLPTGVTGVQSPTGKIHTPEGTYVPVETTSAPLPVPTLPATPPILPQPDLADNQYLLQSNASPSCTNSLFASILVLSVTLLL